MEQNGVRERERGDFFCCCCIVYMPCSFFDVIFCLLWVDRNINGETPLICVFQERKHQYLAVAELLIASGADTTAKTSSGRTALFFCALARDTKGVELLVYHHVPGALEVCMLMNNSDMASAVHVSRYQQRSMKQLLKL
eukprot:m.127704 g.127704  ORF g.127704 m.127704 type:complete len:139 (-) comp13854_c0_seq7:584-1000(-)